MAISQKNYVEVNSAFPVRTSAERILGGLVVTKAEMTTSAYANKAYTDIVNQYNRGLLVAMNISDVGVAFGENSEEYKFAVGYYGYASPTGQTPSILKFAKILDKTSVPYEPEKAYAKDDVVRYAGDGLYYKATEAISKESNTGWDDVSEKFSVQSSYQASLETPTSALTRIDESDNSFGSFTLVGDFTTEELKAVAATNEGFGTRYLFAYPQEKGTLSAIDIVDIKNPPEEDVSESNQALDERGTVFVLGATRYSSYMPMTLFASIDYDNGGVVPCHMFKQFGNETPTVTSDGDYKVLTDNFINFYGQTQSNGKLISFYQRGYNCDGTDTAIYCNEIWFKSRCITRLMDLLISSERVPANDEGVALVRFTVSEVCDRAVANGSFMSKSPSEKDALAIRNIITGKGGSITDASEVINGVENNGYGIWAYLDEDATHGFMVHYYVFYGTADSIRFVKGDDVMVK